MGRQDSSAACPYCGAMIALVPGANPAQRATQPLTQPGANQTQNGQVAREILGSEVQDLDLDLNLKPLRKSAPYPAAFVAFWAVYPRHRDKGKALKAWRNALHRLGATAGATGDANAVLIAGATRYRNDPNREEAFTKYAEGWLNGDGWEDEPLPTRPAPIRREHWSEPERYESPAEIEEITRHD